MVSVRATGQIVERPDKNSMIGTIPPGALDAGWRHQQDDMSPHFLGHQKIWI